MSDMTFKVKNDYIQAKKTEAAGTSPNTIRLHIIILDVATRDDKCCFFVLKIADVYGSVEPCLKVLI